MKVVDAHGLAAGARLDNFGHKSLPMPRPLLLDDLDKAEVELLEKSAVLLIAVGAYGHDKVPQESLDTVALLSRKNFPTTL